MAVQIGVCGAAGRMGKEILNFCHETDDIEIAAAIEHNKSPMINSDAGIVAGIGELGILISDDIATAANKVDVMIDFTHATSVALNLQQCVTANCKMVIGTTGLTDRDHEKIKQASKQIAILFAPNMSVGVNLCLKLLQMAAAVIGHEADIEIIEAHHRHKQDAPSGTALAMGEVIAETLGRDLKCCAVYGREGHTGARDKNSIGFETIRAGDIVGEHTVMFASEGERVEIAHKATSRKTFAAGAIRAAQWLMDKERGLFDMQDVLGLKE